MSLQGRIEELSVRHRRLDEKITHEQRRPVHDSTEIREMKRQKLRNKEELRQLKSN